MTPLRKGIFAGFNLVQRLDQVLGRHNFAVDSQYYLELTPPQRESAYRQE